MPSDSTSVLKHILSILDCLTTEHPEMGVREVARLTNLSSSTVGRLMADMKELGILKQNHATRLYSFGSKVLTWSGVYVSSLNIRTLALPYLDELRHITGETVTLYILEGNDRLCVERMESQHNVRMVTRVGQKLPLYAGSAGKAILAYLPTSQQDEILNTGPLKPLTSKTLVDPAVLRKELENVRQKGFATSYGEWLLEASGVAAPIFGQAGTVIGAISVSGPSPRFTHERVQECAIAVVQTTAQVSQLLGFK